MASGRLSVYMAAQILNFVQLSWEWPSKGKYFSGKPESFYPSDLTNSTFSYLENTMLVFEGHPSVLVIPCIPAGETGPTSKEIYDWRYSDTKPILSNGRFMVDQKNGSLKINHPDTDVDGFYHCNIISSDESVTTYRHTVMTVVFPEFKYKYTVVGVLLSPCEFQGINQVTDDYNDMNKFMLCPPTPNAVQRFASLDCSYEFQVIRSNMTVSLEQENDRSACLVAFIITQSVNKGYKRREDCLDLYCIREDLLKSMLSEAEQTPKFMYKEYQKLYKARMDVPSLKYRTFRPMSLKETVLGFCPIGYRLHDTTICVPCQPGTKAVPKPEGGDVCDQCPVMTYNRKFHQTECQPCPDQMTINSERTSCLEQKKVFGSTEIDMKTLVASGEEVAMELGQDKSRAMGFLRRYNVPIALVVLSSALVVVIIGLWIWRCYRKPIPTSKHTKYTKLYDVSMKDMLQKAAGDVWKREEIVNTMDSATRKEFLKKTLEEQKQYLDAKIAKDKIRQKLTEIRTMPVPS